MAELIQATAINAAPLAVTLSPRHLRMLLLGLGFATGMEFYTADSINLVLTDLRQLRRFRR
jgi:MFS transporter, DHA2 family, multidrug resistance protein